MADRGLLFAGCLALLACGSGDANRDRTMVRDSAGITIVENASPDDSSAYDWWRVEGPLVDLGAEDGASGHELFRVSSALRLGDGRIVVANSGTAELRLFAATGSFLLAAGGRGEGPGEFQSINWLGRDAQDSLYVYDGNAARISVFTADGAFVRDLPFGGSSTRATAIGRFADGTFAGRETVLIRPGQDGPPPQGLQRPDVSILRLASDGQVVDTLGSHPGAERVINVASEGSRILSVEVVTPLLARTSWHVVSGDRLWAGTQDRAELRAYEHDGTLSRIVRTGRELEPVTDRHRNALIERRLESVPRDRRPEVRRGLEGMVVSDFVPPYGALLAARSGDLWVADYDSGLGPAGRWTVYSGEGRGLARIVVPERFTPFDIGEDWILGRELDDLDIEHVRLYRFVRD